MRNDDFIQDVVKHLEEIPVEFISVSDVGLPFDNQYKVIIDRLSFQYPYLRQFVSLASMNDVYVINNPFISSLYNKILIHQLLGKFNIKQPRTIILPKIESELGPNEIINEPDWNKIRNEIKFPCILKPFDGYAWQNVYEVSSFIELQNIYNSLKCTCLLLLQDKILYKEYFRVFCVNKKDVLIIRWIPRSMGLGEYLQTDQNKIESISQQIISQTIQINQLLDLDFNALEWCLTDSGDLYVIDVMNEVPEINKKAIPENYYQWIIERFSNCIKEKFYSGDKNRTIF